MQRLDPRPGRGGIGTGFPGVKLVRQTLQKVRSAQIRRPGDGFRKVGEVLGDGPQQLQGGLVVEVVGAGLVVDVQDIEFARGVPEGGVVLGRVVADGQHAVGAREQFVARLVTEEPDAAVEEVHEVFRDGAGGLEGLDYWDGVRGEEVPNGVDDFGCGGAHAWERCQFILEQQGVLCLVHRAGERGAWRGKRRRGRTPTARSRRGRRGVV